MLFKKGKNMKNVNVIINGVNDVCDFIKAANLVDGDVILYKGRYIVDGKSIMGVLSLDMTSEVNVEYPEDATLFEQAISKFIV